MFQRELMLNRFWLGYFDRIVTDLPRSVEATRPMNGNSPLWIYGHLALCVEFGQRALGQPLNHQPWVSVFGPGSSGDIADPGQYSSAEFLQLIRQGYPALGTQVVESDPEFLNQPHGLDFFKSTPLQTKADFLAHILTTHIAFHTAQLSVCRRAVVNQLLI